MVRKIGRYETLEVLGEGSMGVVYKARDTIINRIVALKTVKMDGGATVAGENPFVKQFYNEARIAGNLSHPNIATIYDVGEDGPVAYLVFEYVKGVTLKDVISQRREIAINDRIRFLVLIARTLHYAHKNGVIHRDIKPANIMVLDDMQAKIMDFGIAVQLSASGPPECRDEGVFTGTPYYMSPEMLSSGTVNKLTDVFSLAVVSYEFLTWEKPFRAGTLNILFNKIASEDPPAPHYLNPMVSELVSAHVMKAMGKETGNRFQSMGEFADALQLYLEQSDKQNTDFITQTRDFDKTVLIRMLCERYSFFADFSEEEMQKLISISGKRRYREGKIIFNEATIGDKMFIILKGKVALTKRSDCDGGETVLSRLVNGDCFGELGFLNNSPRHATATAVKDSVIMYISDTVLRNTEPGICIKLYKNLSSTLSGRIGKGQVKISKLKAENARLKERIRLLGGVGEG
ncbi:MAG: protein kinase [Nitrospirae bacterium]|nr:protein kinase [Nitrospirota bacterium]